MPLPATTCLDAKQQYGNGHFCYTDQFAILTNEFGIVRYIVILDDRFKAAYPEMPMKKKSNFPNEDKSISDSSFLKLVFSDSLLLHPRFYPDTFLDDFAFDTIEKLTASLRMNSIFLKFRSLNLRNESTLEKVSYNTYNIINENTLCCLNGSSLLMKRRNHVKVINN